MPDVRIRSGSGNGVTAHVTTDNLLKVASRTESQEDHEAELGNAYVVEAADVTLTTANTSSLLYIKNTGDDDIVVPNFIASLGTSTGGTFGRWTLEVVRQPTNGTLISGASAATAVNRNFGSNNTLAATLFKGVEGSTITDGVVLGRAYFTAPGHYAVGLLVVLPKGTALAVRLTPPAGNTSADVTVTIAPYVRTVEV